MYFPTWSTGLKVSYTPSHGDDIDFDFVFVLTNLHMRSLVTVPPFTSSNMREKTVNYSEPIPTVKKKNTLSLKK